MSIIRYQGQLADAGMLAVCLKKHPVKCVRLADRERDAREADLRDYEAELPRAMTERERYDFRRGWEYLLGRLVGPRYTWGNIEDVWVQTGSQERVENMVDKATGVDWIRR